MPKNIFAGKYKIHQKTRSKQGPDKVKVKWRQSNHNLDLNYNLMGFDTIEINLVGYFVMKDCSSIRWSDLGLTRPHPLPPHDTL